MTCDAKSTGAGYVRTIRPEPLREEQCTQRSTGLGVVEAIEAAARDDMDLGCDYGKEARKAFFKNVNRVSESIGRKLVVG